jgi:uncharacterized membrane protein YjfL (UPF0719 family)
MIFHDTTLDVISTGVYILLIFISAVITIMGSLMIITWLTRKRMHEKEEIVRNRNVGVAIVLGSFIWTIGRMCLEAIKPIMNAWYSGWQSGFSFTSGLILAGRILASLLIALIVGAVTVYMAIKILMVLTREINEWEQIKNGNIAVAIMIGITVVVVGMFFEPVVSSLVVNLFNFS